MKIFYVVDTNVLINDPNAIMHFNEHYVILPFTVLEELDNLKSSKKSISKDARVATRRLADIIEDCEEYRKGYYRLPSGGLLGFHKTFQEGKTPDDTIIQSAREIKQSGDGNVVIVTNDVNMTVKAKAEDINVQRYRRDEVDIDSDYLPSGYFWCREGFLKNMKKAEYYSEGRVVVPYSTLEGLLEDGYDFTMNDWIIEEDGYKCARVQTIVADEESLIELVIKDRLEMRKRTCTKIVGRNAQQDIAIDNLLNPEIDVVMLLGPAGSGKTLLAMSASIEMAIGKKKSYRTEQIIVTRTPDSEFDDIGFLPGDITDKMGAWMGGVTDNMKYIARANKNDDLLPENAIANGLVEVTALNFMRGRSLNNIVLVIDEAQNLTASQMRTVLTRAGESCKVILLGNLRQIDNNFVSANSSGLTHAVDKLRDYEGASITILEGVERSRLSAYAEENL